MGLRNLLKPKKKIKVVVGDISFYITGDGAVRLDALRKQSGYGADQIVRQALQLYEFCMKEYLKGTLFFIQIPGVGVTEFRIFSTEGEDD